MPITEGRQCSAGFERGFLWNQNTARQNLIPFPPFSFFITRRLSWRSSLGGVVFPVSTLRSVQSSHYSPRDLGGQCYQVEWCYKINWMFRRGKCWRWWTERALAQNHSSLQFPRVLQTRTLAEQQHDWLGKKKKVAIRIIHEQTRPVWCVGHPSFSCAWRGYLCAFSGPVRYWNRHTWLHRGGIRIADGVAEGKGKFSRSMWSEWPRYKATQRGSLFLWCGPMIMLGYSYTCHFNAMFELWFIKSQLMTVNDSNSSLGLKIVSMYSFKVKLCLFLIWIPLGIFQSPLFQRWTTPRFVQRNVVCRNDWVYRIFGFSVDLRKNIFWLFLWLNSVSNMSLNANMIMSYSYAVALM